MAAESLATDDAVVAYLEQLSRWGTTTAVKLWSHMDPAEIRGSWALIDAAAIDAHRVLVECALDAVDDWMTLKAAAAGFAYDVTWRTDHPGRNRQVYWGAEAAPALRRAPIIVLWRISQGVDQAEAMVQGLNYLTGIFGTEAHEVMRNVSLDRVLAG